MAMYISYHTHPIPTMSTSLVEPLLHFRRPLLMLTLQPIMHLSPVPAGMRNPHVRMRYLPILLFRAHAAGLQGCVGGAENALPQVMETVLCMGRPVVPVDKHRAYVVEAVYLVPHGHAKGEVLLP